MLGKTHMVVGIAAGVAILKPDNLPILVTGVGAAALGALLPDIDVGTSESHEDAERVVYLAAASVVIVFLLEHFLKLEVYEQLLANYSLKRILLIATIFIGICGVGMETPHRSFMHSILAMLLLSACVYALFPPLAPYFLVGYASHLLTDCFNRKRVQLFFPLPGGIALGVCHAHGPANSFLFLAGSVASVWLVFTSLMQIMGR